ncbi:MAG: SDR family oxidoreductase [Cohaesibacteraceae bacterium]|nr:SDR family oxidoreductase [Cohaesibacteraceae bacterium]
MSKISGKTALVTGANRGMGKAYVEELLKLGVGKVIATARNPETLNELVANAGGRVVAEQLDVTNQKQIDALAAAHKDVSLLINNAGIAGFAGLIHAPDLDAARAEIETNYFGLLNVTRAFAPILAANGGGAIVNMASIASYVSFPVLGSYSASKAAVHSLTQGVRAELAAQGTLVVGVYPGPVDTDMAESFPVDKTPADVVVRNVLEAVEAGQEDVYPDPVAAEMHAGLMSNPKAVEKQTGEMLPG